MTSRCCAAPVEVIHEDEGQSYWLCTSCHNQCGVTDEYQKQNHMINQSTDTTMRYDKGLPRKRRLKGKFKFWCNEHKHYWYSEDPGGFVPSKPKDYPFPCKNYWKDMWNKLGGIEELASLAGYKKK